METLGSLKGKALLIVLLGLVMLGLGVGFTSITNRSPQSLTSFISGQNDSLLTKAEINEALKGAPSSVGGQFPNEVSMNVGGQEKVPVQVRYSFDAKLQKTMEGLFEAYDPDYGAFVAMDPTTGRILAIVSHSKNRTMEGNLALRATFPSASVFKVVTAAAAIEAHKVSANTVLPFHGRRHTLYRSQIFKSNVTRWTRFTTLKEAFAHSNNIIFGRLGAFILGTNRLKDYADRFGFNHKITADLPIQEGRAAIPNDMWGLAESASGYTLENTMSPLQGALIAATIANEGVMMEPFAVESLSNAAGTTVYTAEPKIATIAIDPDTAAEIKKLMQETVRHGTSRGSFRGFFRKEFALLNVGGKTGSLTGMDPHGKCDWFVGYADSGSKRIAVAALTVHEKYWRVKSAYLARKAIEDYFKGPFPKRIKNLKNVAATGL